MRIGQVTGDEDQVRTPLLEQLPDDGDIVVAYRVLAHATRAIERQVEEPRLTTSQPDRLEPAHGFGLRMARLRSRTSGVSTSPGFLAARNFVTRSRSA